MDQELLSLYNDATLALLALTHKIDVSIRDSTQTPEGYVDIVYLLRRGMNRLERTRITLEYLIKSCEHRAINLWAPANKDKPKSIKGKLATGTPRIGCLLSAPRKKSKEWRELCMYLGMSGVAIDEGIVTMNWKKFIEYVQKHIKDGGEMPPHMKKVTQKTTYALRITPKVRPQSDG